MDRSHREDGEREVGVGAEHHEEGESDLSGGLEDLADDDVQSPRHASDVHGEPGHELPGPALVEIAQGQGQQVGMERDQHVALDHQLHVREQDLGGQAQQGHGHGDQQEEPGGAGVPS